jgi:hypothetical protein
MALIAAFVVVMQNRFNFDIVEICLAAFSCRLFDITNSFTDVNKICDARHIFLPRRSLPTPHKTRGHNEYR